MRASKLSPTPNLPDDLTLRRAGPEDNEAILDFMRAQGMRAGLSLRFDRSPDYFALHEAHSPDHVTWIVTRRDCIVATTSVVTRQAYVDRAVCTVAYLADLRQARGRGLAGIWRDVAQAVLNETRREFGATLAYCSILRGNRLARSSILDSSIGRQLGLRHLRSYRTISVVGRVPWSRRSTGRIEVCRASPRDGDRLRAFVDSESRNLQFAPVFDQTTWQRRIDNWPGFGIGNFLIAADGHGRILGCLAPWDSSSISRIVIDGLPLPVEFLRRAVNATVLVTRRPRIPVGPTTHIPDVALTHVRVANREPAVFAALLDVAYRELIGARKCATLSFCLYDEDPLWRAQRYMIYSTIPMDLYWMPLDRTAAPPRQKELWPGFEPYLV